MSTEKLPRYAADREALFFQHMTESRNGKLYLTGFALFDIIKQLLVIGATHTEAITYLQMAWRAGEKLNYEVTTIRLSRDLGRRRTAVHHTIRHLEKKGLVKKYAMNHYKFTELPGITTALPKKDERMPIIY